MATHQQLGSPESSSRSGDHTQRGDHGGLRVPGPAASLTWSPCWVDSDISESGWGATDFAWSLNFSRRVEFQTGSACQRPADPRGPSGSFYARLFTDGDIPGTTAVQEVDCGLLDGLKFGLNLRVGVEIHLHLRTDLVLGLALEGREEIVHGRVSE